MARLTVVLSVLFVILVLLSTAPATAQTPAPRKYIIFRDDDVAMGRETATLKAVNQIHIDVGVPVTLAIVPHPYGSLPLVPTTEQPSWMGWQEYSGSSSQLLEDRAFYDYMRTISSNPLFEFAQHGYAHQSNGLATSSHNTSEFAGEPYSVQYSMIRAGRDDIKEAFGKAPATFIPPWDRGDADTLAAVRALGFSEYCTGGTEMMAVRGAVSGIRVEPADFDIYGSSYAALNQSVTTARGRIDQFLNDPHSDTFIIGYHFWTFNGPKGSADLKKMQLLRDFVTYVKQQRQITFTTLDRSVTVSSDVSPPAADNTPTPSSGSVLGDLSLDAPHLTLNVAADGILFYSSIALVLGVVLAGRSLYVRRGRKGGARSAAKSPRTAERHAPTESSADTVSTRLSGSAQEALRTYGVVISPQARSRLATSSDDANKRSR